MKETIEFEDVGMIGKHLNFDLLNHLVLHVSFLNIFFAYHFYGQSKASSDVSCHIDISETSFSQFSAHFKLGKGKFFSFSGNEHTAEIKQRLIGVLSASSNLAFCNK